MARWKKYEWDTPAEEREVRKKNDRERKLIKYWRNKYGLEVTFDQLETFINRQYTRRDYERFEQAATHNKQRLDSFATRWPEKLKYIKQCLKQ